MCIGIHYASRFNVFIFISVSYFFVAGFDYLIFACILSLKFSLVFESCLQSVFYEPLFPLICQVLYTQSFQLFASFFIFDHHSSLVICIYFHFLICFFLLVSASLNSFMCLFKASVCRIIPLSLPSSLSFCFYTFCISSWSYFLHLSKGQFFV